MIQRVFERQQLAEWRDRQIVGAGALLNLRAADARRELEAGLGEATAADSMFGAVRLGRSRADSLMRTALAADLPAHLAAAGGELVAINPDLADLAQALTAFMPAWPDAGDGTAADEGPEPAPEPGPDPSPEVEPAGGWLDGLAGRVGRGVAVVSRTAGSARDALVNERLGLVRRIRSAAHQRIAEAWLGEQQPGSVIDQLVIRIDRIALEARIRLS